MDGWVIVGTKLDSKQLEKDLKNAERRLQQYEKEAEKLTKAKAKAEIDLQPYEEQKRIIQEITDEALQYAQTEQEVENQLKLEKTQLEELNQKYSKQLGNLESINNKIKENTKNQSLMKNQIEETRKKTSDLNIDLDKVSKSTSNTIKKVAKWALAIFGVRSAYMFVRQSASTLAQYNEKIASDLEYIRFALASSLQPVIEGLIQLVYKLLTYVNYIAQAWFGVNLFANASAKAMNKGAKSAEKMKKSLAGFDEMNIIQDTSTSSAGGGATAPSIDLSQWQGEVPSWIQWIADNKDIVIAGLLGIAGGLTAVGFGLTAIQGFGIGLILAGIILLIQGIVDFIKDPSWDNFLTILQGIALVVAGIAILMGAWIVALVALGVAIVAYVIKNWDKVKEILGKVGSWIYDNIIKPVADFFVNLWQGIKDGVGSAVQWVKDKFNSIVNFFSGLISKIVGLFKTIGTKVGNAIGSAFKIVINGVLNAIENILNFPIKSINKLIGVINKVPGINIKTLPTFNLPRLAVGGIVNMPGRGVPVGGAITGEAGREGVIPLTDSQAMETLGQAIGRYITINASITNTMNGRVISKELKRINNDSDFAFNK